jgi:hypothetical protein
MKSLQLQLTTIILFITFSCFGQINYEKFTITDIGEILIPDIMELQSGNYKKYSDAVSDALAPKYIISGNKIVFQQKGLNDFSDESFKKYYRVIIETDIGKIDENNKLTTKLSYTKSELDDISKLSKEQFIKEFSSSSVKIKLLDWYGVSIATINGYTALKISYLRQIGDNAPVIVNMYLFENNDRTHTLTMSYRKDDEITMKPVFNKIINSFKITNIR